MQTYICCIPTKKKNVDGWKSQSYPDLFSFFLFLHVHVEEREGRDVVCGVSFSLARCVLKRIFFFLLLLPSSKRKRFLAFRWLYSPGYFLLISPSFFPLLVIVRQSVREHSMDVSAHTHMFFFFCSSLFHFKQYTSISVWASLLTIISEHNSEFQERK